MQLEHFISQVVIESRQRSLKQLETCPTCAEYCMPCRNDFFCQFATGGDLLEYVRNRRRLAEPCAKDRVLPCFTIVSHVSCFTMFYREGTEHMICVYLLFPAMPYAPAFQTQVAVSVDTLGRTSSSSCLRAWITYTRRWSFTGRPGVM